MPKLRMYGDTSNLYSYFRPTPDRKRILLGSRGFDKIEVTDRTVNYLKRKLCLIFPELSNVKIDFCWQGNVGFTRPQLPVIFEHDEIYYAAGYAGSGTVWARWLGKKLQKLLWEQVIDKVFFMLLHLKVFHFMMGTHGFYRYINITLH